MTLLHTRHSKRTLRPIVETRPGWRIAAGMAILWRARTLSQYCKRPLRGLPASSPSTICISPIRIATDWPREKGGWERWSHVLKRRQETKSHTPPCQALRRIRSSIFYISESSLCRKTTLAATSKWRAQGISQGLGEPRPSE